MSELELHARRSTRSPYAVLPQRDGGLSSPSADKYGSTNGQPKIIHRMGSFESTSKTESVSVKSRKSASLLAPKSFPQLPASRRIWTQIATATATIFLVAIPFGIVAVVWMTDVHWNPNDREFTYCSNSDQYLTSSGSLSSAFNIDCAYGNLSFGTAKFVDLVWDIGFSRGGQAMLGWIAYRVNTAALLRIMETQPISYEFFSSLSLSWSSIASLGPVIKALFKSLGFKKKLLILWIVLSILWVAIWPTITNAMTGYIAQNETLVKLKGNEVAYGNFSDVASLETLAFQFTNYTYVPGNRSQDTNEPIGPLLYQRGPNSTLWNELYQSKSHTITQPIRLNK